MKIIRIGFCLCLLLTIFSFISSIYAQQEQLTITTYYPSPFGSYRQLQWGAYPNDSRGLLSDEEGSSIRLGGLRPGGVPAEPHIDFHRDMVSSYDARIRLSGPDELRIEGAVLNAEIVSDGRIIGRSQPGPAEGALGYYDAENNVRSAVYGNANSPVAPANWAGYFEGKVRVTGDFEVLGSKSAIVDTKDFGKRLVYSLESPGVWLEDFGSANLINGRAIVKIDPIFLQSVNTELEYYVFTMPQSNTKGLYVAEKNKDFFIVKEIDCGKSSIKFDYRIIANRKGYENIRLSKVIK